MVRILSQPFKLFSISLFFAFFLLFTLLLHSPVVDKKDDQFVKKTKPPSLRIVENKTTRATTRFQVAGELTPSTPPPVNESYAKYLRSIHSNLESLIIQEYEEQMKDPKQKDWKRKLDQLPIPKTHIIIHLPKTGGTTLGLLARRNENFGKFKQYWYHISETDLPYLPRYANVVVLL